MFDHSMRIALLISGHCRTFVYQEQRIFFEKLIKYLSPFGKCDTYLMLKTDHLMQTDQGMSNLQKIIQTINPVYSVAFKQWRENDDNCYYSQMKMIRHLVDKSIINDYDYYIRIRPDCIIPDLSHIKFNQPLCTSRKFDALGNDQFFIMSKKAVKEWFLNLPITVVNTSPEYYIFDHVDKCINSGLVRSYKRIQSWNFYHCHLNVKNYWLPEQTFQPVPYDIFINKLKIIMQYHEVL